MIWITYFREYFDTGIIQKSKPGSIEYLTVAGMNTRDHFHNLDESLLKIANSPSLCMKCHGSYPHSKSKQLRAFLNAHAYFMACEVCHLENEKRRLVKFKWLDDKTGKAMNFYPTKLRAKIVPIVTVADSFKRLDETGDSQFVGEYLAVRNELDADQEAAAKVRIHQNVSDTAISCDDCHTAEKTPYLPYEELNFSPQRIADISGTEVVGMINKYKNFYLPNLLQDGSRDSE
ncbi:MAG: hypothetical protein AB2792_16605 [Candidatus Thiodiazotropha sp.]